MYVHLGSEDPNPFVKFQSQLALWAKHVLVNLLLLGTRRCWAREFVDIVHEQFVLCLELLPKDPTSFTKRKLTGNRGWIDFFPIFQWWWNLQAVLVCSCMHLTDVIVGKPV